MAKGYRIAHHVALEFKDCATALACYESPGRQRVSRGDLAVIEGYDGTQPA